MNKKYVPNSFSYIRNEKLENRSLKTRCDDLPQSKWMTIAQAAKYIGTTVGGMRNRVYRGQIKQYKPFGKLGRSYFKRTELDRLMGAS